MKGLILAAGEGRRLHPITTNVPKPLLIVGGKTLIEYNIDKLIELGIDEIGIVINEKYLKDFALHLSHYTNIANITFIYQNTPMGVAHAIYEAKDFIGDSNFITILGDNYITGSLEVVYDIMKFGKPDIVLTVCLVDNPEDYGIVEFKNGDIKRIVEKPNNPKSNLASVGVYAFNKDIFKSIKNIGVSRRGEFEITDAINYSISKLNAKVYSVSLKSIDVGTHDRLELVRDLQ